MTDIACGGPAGDFYRAANSPIDSNGIAKSLQDWGRISAG
jgi:hypothetical protein